MSALLPSQLGWVFLIAILDAALISWIALRWYRRAVRRLMAEGATLSVSTGPIAPAVEPTSSGLVAGLPPLNVAVFQADGPKVRASRLPRSRGETRRLALAYAIGAGLHSAVITAFVFDFDWTQPFATWFGQWWVFAWPIVPTFAVLFVLNRRETIKLTLGYVLLGSIALAAVTLALQAARGSFSSAPLTNLYWFAAGLLLTAAPPLALLLITGWRRVRAVTPLALSSTLIFGFALLLFREALTAAFNLPAVRDFLLAVARTISTQAVYYGAFMILVLPVGWIAWQLLQALAIRFERKHFSDVQLIVDCWWLIVTAEELTLHLSTTYGGSGIAVAMIAFAAYRSAVALVLSRGPRLGNEEPKRLLLLRVFGHQTRTEKLFDRVAQQWRFRGPVQLIAGVDLAMRTVDPGDMLAFISGRLNERYVATPGEVAPRIQALDMHPDPDGRFRVNEVYCRDTAWRPALQALLGISDIVLMDLRSFSTVNSGCAFELEQLVLNLPPERIVLVYDKTTDLRLLSNVLGERWQHAARDRGLSGGSLSCVRIERNSWAELNVLMRSLLGQDHPHQVLTVADLARA